MSHGVPNAAAQAVLVKSEPMPADASVVRGYDFEGALDYDALMRSLYTTGYQATSLGQAIGEVNRMLRWRLSDEAVTEETDEDERGEAHRANVRTKIFLGWTSNLTSSGTRETIKYLCKNKMIDVLCTTAGGVEEDFIKCMKPTYLGDFALRGKDLRGKGLNRIGNLIQPNDNYCDFEDWIMPILDAMLREQNEEGVKWTCSSVIKRLGMEINHEDSIFYWAAKNDIPCYCPALTDGSIGDMLYFHSYKNPGLVIDVVADVRAMNDESIKVKRPRKTGIIILGGGVAKHHICNSNLMRNGLRRVHQHRARVRWKRLRCTPGRGSVLGKDHHGCQTSQMLRRRHYCFSHPRRRNFQEELRTSRVRASERRDATRRDRPVLLPLKPCNR
jgi:deoxyhypusine synthase